VDPQGQLPALQIWAVERHLAVPSASAITDVSLLRIEKSVMTQVLHQHPALAERFIVHLLSRNIRFEEDLIDQLFNSSEKRLARVLLLLAHFGKDGTQDAVVVQKMSQETLAELVGTTRPRISSFMNKFRNLGFIEYNGGLRVHSSLLNVVLND